jgi:putative DNA primase/helicase
MLPDTNPTTEAKGPDWEDLIVANGVLDLPIAERFDRLREFAQEGGVFTPRGHAKKSFSKQFEAGRVAA